MAGLPDEAREQLTAYLDGEMDRAAAAAFENRLRRDPELRREAEALKRTWDLLDFLPQPEPSAHFTSRTLDKLAVVRPEPAPARPQPRTDAQRSRGRHGLLIIAAAVILFVVGFLLPGDLLKSGPRRLSRDETDRQIAQDLRLLEHLPQYQLAEDVDFLLGLDEPDLFGN